MIDRVLKILLCVGFLAGVCSARAEEVAVELARSGQEHSTVRLEPARYDGKAGIAVVFKGTSDLHYYATSDTAPAPGMQLKVEAKGEGFEFGEAIFPKWGLFKDLLGQSVEVYVGDFSIFVPIKSGAVTGEGDIEAKISGIVCTSMLCLPPFEQEVRTKVDWSSSESWQQISFVSAEVKEPVASSGGQASGGQWTDFSILAALGLALVAGLSLNIMPCVWPILPIIVMRLVDQAAKDKSKSLKMGLAFCLGIMLFFTTLAGLNAVLQIFFKTVLQWGDPFRLPSFVAFMAMLLVTLALFMFGLFTVTIPSSISGKSSSGEGYAGAIGMGFLAAILSTPCSFGILMAAFAWAQAQPLPLATLAIMVIGLGMAIPYAILTALPGLPNKTPKPGQWMDLVKQAMGFILLGIAAKMIAALPADRRMNALMYAVVLSFCIWIWGAWVGFGTKATKKWFIRLIAVALALWSGMILLAAPKAELIDWQKYDDGTIQSSISDGKPVLIKFTADWCVSCKVLDKLVFAREDVAELVKAKGVVAIKADTTVKDYPATKALESKYKENGVPVTVLLIPGASEDVRFRGIFGADELTSILKSLPVAQDELQR